MNTYNPAIVVVAFNRKTSLVNLLSSLSKANFEKDEKIKLIISIDYCETNIDVLQVANDFQWCFGEKEVIYQEKNLGLKKHILKCGDLTQKYGSIILLEDDLYVSPYFYDYTKKALEFYSKDKNISQISLYKHPINQNTNDNFIQYEEDNDVFFLQFASSWGQAWTSSQWQNFKKWFEKNDLKITQSDNLPDFVIKWKETSWLKYFIKYNQENDKFVVYPKVSLTSNFSDSGTNVSISDNIYLYQQSLLSSKKIYTFKSLEESTAVYDVYFDVFKGKLSYFIKEYKDIEFDLYGIKKLSKIKSKYLLSIKNCKKPIKTYGRYLKPQEINILHNIEGKELSLGLTKDFEDSINKNILKENFKYYWTHSVDYFDVYITIKMRLKQQYINLKKRIKQIIKG